MRVRVNTTRSGNPDKPHTAGEVGEGTSVGTYRDFKAGRWITMQTTNGVGLKAGGNTGRIQEVGAHKPILVYTATLRIACTILYGLGSYYGLPYAPHKSYVSLGCLGNPKPKSLGFRI